MVSRMVTGMGWNMERCEACDCGLFMAALVLSSGFESETEQGGRAGVHVRAKNARKMVCWVAVSRSGDPCGWGLLAVLQG
jgi:hypothetical protein